MITFGGDPLGRLATGLVVQLHLIVGYKVCTSYMQLLLPIANLTKCRCKTSSNFEIASKYCSL